MPSFVLASGDATSRSDSGLVVSVVGLGCNNFGLRLGLDETRAVVRAALDAGITLFDTADSYGDSEEILGELLQHHRDDVVLATKFGPRRGRAQRRRLGCAWLPVATSGERSRRPCAGCAPITSTSTSCTDRTR